MLLVAALATAAAARAASSGDTRKVVTITCSACQNSPTDPFLRFNYEAVQRFNAAYRGRYQVKIVQNPYAGSGPQRLQYYQRLALARSLPDAFLLQRSELQTLESSGQLLDFAPILAANPAWKGSFYPGSFAALTDKRGRVFAIPQERDSIGATPTIPRWCGRPSSCGRCTPTATSTRTPSPVTTTTPRRRSSRGRRP
jgi:ABC-type glycerol-3-phosphate transport system substrate-binding protein